MARSVRWSLGLLATSGLLLACGPNESQAGAGPTAKDNRAKPRLGAVEISRVEQLPVAQLLPCELPEPIQDATSLMRSALAKSEALTTGAAGKTRATTLSLQWIALDGPPALCALAAKLGALPPEVLERSTTKGANPSVIVALPHGNAGEIEAGEVEDLVQRAARILDTQTAIWLEGEAACRRRADRGANADADELLVCADWLIENFNKIDSRRWNYWSNAAILMLKSNDHELHRAGLTLLAEVGDERHADAVISELRLARPGMTALSYETLAQLGGDSAEAFLRFAVRNEDTEEGWRLAERALKNLRSRTSAQGTRPQVPPGHRR